MATVRVVTAKNGSEAAGPWLNDRAAALVLVSVRFFFLYYWSSLGEARWAKTPVARQPKL
jgi:hypothetical protein